MKKVFVMFVFAVMIGSMISVSAQLGQTGTTTVPPKYTINDCVAMEKGMIQKVSDITMGLAQHPNDPAFPLLLGASGAVGAFGMVASAVWVGMGIMTIPVAIPVMVIGGGLVYYSYRILKVAAQSIGAVSSQEDCYSSVALSLGNADICKKVMSTTTRGSCYLDIAIAKKDFSLCEKIPPYSASRDTCYYRYAMQSNDAGLCQQIGSSGTEANALRTICVSNLAK